MVEFCDIPKKDIVANLWKTRSAFNSAALAQVIDNGRHSVNLGLMPNKRRYVKTIADAVRERCHSPMQEAGCAKSRCLLIMSCANHRGTWVAAFKLSGKKQGFVHSVW